MRRFAATLAYRPPLQTVRLAIARLTAESAFLDVGTNRSHQQSTIDMIKGGFDIKLDHPVITLPTPLSGDSNGLFR